jgi:hypothetical protein
VRQQEAEQRKRGLDGADNRRGERESARREDVAAERAVLGALLALSLAGALVDLEAGGGGRLVVVVRLARR